MASFVVKAPPRPEGAERLDFDEKSMWRGKTIRAGDEVFLFAAEHHGGHGPMRGASSPRWSAAKAVASP